MSDLSRQLLSQAISNARRLAAKRLASTYVVWAGEDPSDDEYAVAGEEDLDTWWLDATVIGEVLPDGTFIGAN